MTDSESRALPSSFRDPSGFLFERDGVLLRHVAPSYREHYKTLMESGLYEQLVANNHLIPHEETDRDLSPGSHAVLRPVRIPFVSYPYEWSFGMLRHAALKTLRIQSLALEHGMSLKDASAYNIQFVNGRPIFIDTLSFEKRAEGSAWVAYRQFCQQFLGPLALMAYRDVRLSSLLRAHIDGVPLDICSKLLPTRTRLRPGLALHIHTHAAAQRKLGGKGGGSKQGDGTKKGRVSDRAMVGLVDSLRGTVRGLRWEPRGTEWAEYYGETNYSRKAAQSKRDTVKRFLQQISPNTVWDLGANDGRYSRLAAEAGAQTVAFDIDPAAVEQGYRAVRKEQIPNLLPLVVDLSNPSPAIGWSHRERMSLLQRGPVDCVMGLALVHHLAIGNNVPWASLMSFLAQASSHVILEFVPKDDSQVQRMLKTREDIFTEYDREHFESAAAEQFTILERVDVEDSHRALYLLKRRNGV